MGAEFPLPQSLRIEFLEEILQFSLKLRLQRDRCAGARMPEFEFGRV